MSVKNFLLTLFNKKYFSEISAAILEKTSYAELEDKIGKRYEKSFGRKLNWDNPQTFTEKINVSKIYMPAPLKTRLADKYLVRKWIKEKIGEEYLIPLFGVYNSFDEINFEILPNKFVIKCNHDWNSVTLCNDKRKLNLEELKQKYDKFMQRNFGLVNFEMQYYAIKPKILVEKYMGNSIEDYKFMCLEGRPRYCWMDFDRFTNHTRNFYDLDWNLQTFSSANCKNYDKKISVPEKFEEMKKIVSKLCRGFDQVRVDLYCVEDKIYFGEMTFTTDNDFGKFSPDEWDYKIGALWPFDNSVRKKILKKYSRP